MRFKFYPIESRIFDFLQFPTMIYAKDHYEKIKEHDDRLVPSYVDYLDFLNKADAKLKPYIKEIELFYMDNIMEEYDFIGLISNANRIIGYKCEKEYLDMLLGLNDKDISKSIAYSILSASDNNLEYSEELMTRAEAISLDRTDLIALIKNLPIEASSKWTLFLYIEEPVKYMKMYVEFMYRILPIFTELYGLYEEEVNRYGQDLVKFLNENGTKGLEEKTYSILDSKIMDNEENSIFISATLQFAIYISGLGPYNYIAWGLRMEEAFKRMKEMSENKINERVQVFKNLGDKTRYQVIKLIASGETSTKEIAQALGVSSATISYHINNLLQSKIIKIDRTENRYSYLIDHELLEEIINGLKEDLKVNGHMKPDETGIELIK
ncbi:MAG: ArsR family transcriptional regulator [Bacillota bacterium]|nr:ArsR family transcriptional regulator [Bacillota bacterium]